MKKNNLSQAILLLTACFFYMHSFPINSTEQKSTIKIVCTAAIIPQYYELRKQQYIRALNLLKNYGYDPYVVESCQSGPTFLDEVCNHVCYAQSNNSSYTNKGLSEARSLWIGLKRFNFDPEDMIVKLTGRYSLESDEFIKLIKTNPNADAFVRAWSSSDAYTGLFALKLKYFSDFLNNYINSDQNSLAFEHALGPYITNIREQGASIIYPKSIRLLARLLHIFAP